MKNSNMYENKNHTLSVFGSTRILLEIDKEVTNHPLKYEYLC